MKVSSLRLVLTLSFQCPLSLLSYDAEQSAWVLVPTCGTCGTLGNLSVPRFPICKMSLLMACLLRLLAKVKCDHAGKAYRIVRVT